MAPPAKSDTLAVTLTIQLDQKVLDVLRSLISDDPTKLAALTAQLKAANDALSKVVAQNEPK